MLVFETDKNFLFGAAQESITPKQFRRVSLAGYGRWSRCKGVHDLIYVRVNVFLRDNADKSQLSDDPNDPVNNNSIGSDVLLVLLNFDLTGFGFKNGDLLREQVHKQLKIDKSRIHFYSTHSHYAPDTESIFPAPVFPNVIFQNYNKHLVQLIIRQSIKAIRKAIMNAVPCKIGYGSYKFPEKFVHNRRPPKGYYQIIHPNIHVIKISNLENDLIGLITIFPSHPVIIDGELNEISGGWPGFFVRALRKDPELFSTDRSSTATRIKKNFVPLIFQGPAGNATGRYFGPFPEIEEFRKKIAEKRQEFIEKYNGGNSQKLNKSMRKKLRKYIKKFRKNYPKYKELQYLASYKFALTLAKHVVKLTKSIETSPLRLIIINSKRVYIPLTPVYKKLDIAGLRSILYAAVKRIIVVPLFKLCRGGDLHFVNLKRKKLPFSSFKRLCLETRVTTIVLNDIIITGNPGEPYYNMEREIKSKINSKKVALAELCDDAIGYNWTDEQHIFEPYSYDAQMSYSPLTGIITRSIAIKEIKEIEKFKNIEKR
ncbi:MAG: hypothetical protein ACTSXF_01195 [Promethearchaeota archaeon]